MHMTKYLAWLGILSIAGCTDFGWINLEFQTGTPDRKDSESARLKRIESGEEWTTFFVSQVEAQQQRQTEPECAGLFGFWEDVDTEQGLGEDDGMAPAPLGDEALGGDGGDRDEGAPEDANNETDFTDTNLQEFGVDEADVVKTDGEYFYMLVGSELRIIKAYPAEEMAEIASLELDSADYSTSDLYLNGDRLVAITQPSYYFYDEIRLASQDLVEADEDEYYPYYENDKTVVTLVDISDHSNPQVEANWRFDGYYNNSRMIDGLLHIIITQYPYIPYDLDPQELTEEIIDQFIPQYTVTFADQTEKSGALVTFEDFYHPVDPDGYTISTIVSLDTNEVATEISSTAIMADTGTIYSSRNALYLTDPDYDYYCSYRETLDIHKFEFSATGTVYTASGSVEGRLLNQFSLGEQNDYLRVATTTGETWDWSANSSKNHIYILEEDGDQLSTIGAIEDVAPGEQIYAARFLGDKGFLVTFRQTDPLFTLDLSDPANPSIAGKLKVPGFSEYIHVLDDNYLLTLGRDATEEGQVLGLQLSIFDVSDFTEPELATSLQIGTSGTYSEAEYNHKAFTYYAAENLLAIPVDLYENQDQEEGYGSYTFSGVQVYQILPEEGITLLGQVSTSDTGDYGYPSYWGWTRGIFIEDSIFAVTETGVQVASISSPNQVLGSLDIEGSPYWSDWDEDWGEEVPATTDSVETEAENEESGTGE